MSYQILSGSTQVALVTQALVIEANNQIGPSALALVTQVKRKHSQESKDLGWKREGKITTV